MPLAGLAIGALGCGVLIQFAPADHPDLPDPAGGAGVCRGRCLALARNLDHETGRPRVTVTEGRPAGPPQAPVLLAAPDHDAGWALAGLYLSPGPSIARASSEDDPLPDRRDRGHGTCGTAVVVYRLRHREPVTVIRFRGRLAGRRITIT